MTDKQFEKLSIQEYQELKEKIIAYAKEYNEKGMLPPFSDACIRFDLTGDQLEQICEDTDELIVNTGIQTCFGVGSLRQEDWTIEVEGII